MRLTLTPRWVHIPTSVHFRCISAALLAWGVVILRTNAGQIFKKSSFYDCPGYLELYVYLFNVGT